VTEQANMVVMKPFPNQSLHFLEDPGNKRYHESYYEAFAEPTSRLVPERLRFDQFEDGGLAYAG
jgi:hypothetical protein